MMNLEELRANYRETILRLVREHGARDPRVFGSVARGTATADSDIDLLVELEPGRSLLDLGGLLIDLQQVLGRPVDVVTVQGLRPRIRERVLSETVEI